MLLGASANDPRWGIVVEMEHRRKSGRTVSERFYVPRSNRPSSSIVDHSMGTSGVAGLKSSSSSSSSPSPSSTTPILLEDHPLYRPSISSTESSTQSILKDDDELVSSTFDLTLTPKQRDDRAGVILPYFDAQRGEGGTGGRILYDMGVEDDFDEEEDEI